jgi:hypothetical protein
MPGADGAALTCGDLLAAIKAKVDPVVTGADRTCKSDADCTAVGIGNLCYGDPCSPVFLSRAGAAVINAELTDIEVHDCDAVEKAGCASGGTGPYNCPLEGVPTCVAGRCQDSLNISSPRPDGGTGAATGTAGTTSATGSAGATGSGGTPGGDGARDAGACGDPYANSSMPMAPCAVDSDCHSAYLFCGPPQDTVEGCRDADAAVDDCAPPAFADLPICPATKRITANLCGIRYQRPCQVDSDCGPGFTCGPSDASMCPAGSPCGTCQEPPLATCVTKANCPKGWDCYDPCPCPTMPNAQTYCYPPFAGFNCPACPATPGP